MAAISFSYDVVNHEALEMHFAIRLQRARAENHFLYGYLY